MEWAAHGWERPQGGVHGCRQMLLSLLMPRPSSSCLASSSLVIHPVSRVSSLSHTLTFDGMEESVLRGGCHGGGGGREGSDGRCGGSGAAVG